MTQMTETATRPRRLPRSTGAVLLGFVSVVVLSLATDQVLHVLEVYPPWGQPMYAPALNLLALSYRIVYRESDTHGVPVPAVAASGGCRARHSLSVGSLLWPVTAAHSAGVSKTPRFVLYRP